MPVQVSTSPGRSCAARAACAAVTMISLPVAFWMVAAEI
jgi:hypothetical protein